MLPACMHGSTPQPRPAPPCPPARLPRPPPPCSPPCRSTWPQVFARGAKFSLFKPAEEMVYIGLDDESRTKVGGGGGAPARFAGPHSRPRPAARSLAVVPGPPACAPLLGASTSPDVCALDLLLSAQGKAAIDVVGAQSGKSIGSMLQQALLILRYAQHSTAQHSTL